MRISLAFHQLFMIFCVESHVYARCLYKQTKNAVVAFTWLYGNFYIIAEMDVDNFYELLCGSHIFVWW